RAGDRAGVAGIDDDGDGAILELRQHRIDLVVENHIGPVAVAGGDVIGGKRLVEPVLLVAAYVLYLQAVARKVEIDPVPRLRAIDQPVIDAGEDRGPAGILVPQDADRFGR